MPTFKKGDKVRVVRLDYMDRSQGFRLGEVYTIDSWTYDVHSPNIVWRFEEVADAWLFGYQLEKVDEPLIQVGRLVSLRNGYFYVVSESIKQGMFLLNEKLGEVYLMRYYNSDLTCKSSSRDIDIVEVYSILQMSSLDPYDLSKRELIWKRNEVKEMTVAEISQALGHELKVVK